MSIGMRCSRFLPGAIVLAIVAGMTGAAMAQTQPFDDHQNMMDQLGVPRDSAGA